jgi:hypothetical protein
MSNIDTLIQNFNDFNDFNIPTSFCNLSEITYDDYAVNGQKITLYFWDTYEPEYRTMDGIYTFIMMKKCRGDKWVTLLREDGKETSKTVKSEIIGELQSSIKQKSSAILQGVFVDEKSYDAKTNTITVVVKTSTKSVDTAKALRKLMGN